MRRFLRSSVSGVAGFGLLVGLMSGAPTGAAAPARAEPDAFAAIVAKSLVAARPGIRKRCHTQDTESEGVPPQFRARMVRGRWVWWIAYDARDETGEFSTIAGKGRARYTQFTQPISRKGLAKLRKAGRPDALGLRAPYFDSQREWAELLFSLGEPVQLSPNVWGDEWARWEVRRGIIVAYWLLGRPRDSWGCTFTYADTKVPALGIDARYLSRRWQNKHEWLPGKHLPLDEWQYLGRMR